MEKYSKMEQECTPDVTSVQSSKIAYLIYFKIKLSISFNVSF